MFRAKPFYVEARQVTCENVSVVAAWCGGNRYREAVTDSEGWTLDAPVVKLANGLIAGRESWVVKMGDSFVPFTNREFLNLFEAVAD